MTTRPQRVPSAEHADHDAFVIAGLAAGDELAVEEQTRADAQLASCAACRATLADLANLTDSLRTDLLAPRRLRDFRLTPEMAARARGNRLSRWFSQFGTIPAFQPVAAAVCSIGLVLVLVGVALPVGGSQSLLQQTLGGASVAAPLAPVSRESTTTTDTSGPGASAQPTPSLEAAFSAAPPSERAYTTPLPKSSDVHSLVPGFVGTVTPSAQDERIPQPAAPIGGATLGALLASLGVVLFVGGVLAIFLGRRARAHA